LAGGGKTFSLLFDVLKYIDCPYYYAVFLRKTLKQIERGLWGEAKRMYRPFLVDDNGKYYGKAQIKEQAKTIVFPSGAKVEFAYLDGDNTTEENWQGVELTAAYYDEFTHQSKFNFNYVGTRLRSPSKYKSYVRCSLNPHPTHFVHEFLDIFIDQKTGFAKEELSGKPAYYVDVDNVAITSFDKEELLEKYPNKKPIKYTFIPSKLEDNKKMLEVNEDYQQQLEATGKANAAMLLSGNWKYTPEANGMWERSSLLYADKIPLNCNTIRAWDKAASKPAKEGGDSKQLDPDYTASIGMAKDKDGFIYIFGNFIEDENGKQIARFREKPGPRDKHIEKQTIKDGVDTVVVLPKDSGQAGVVEFQESAKKLQELGFTVKQDPSVSNRSKAKRFEPFVAACHNGVVYWVKSTFDEAAWEYMILELENFDGDKNNGFHDDIVDTLSSGFCTLTRTKVHQAVPLPSMKTKPTGISSLRNQLGTKPMNSFKPVNYTK
jgi:phage terminase large subunit-like protein